MQDQNIANIHNFVFRLPKSITNNVPQPKVKIGYRLSSGNEIGFINEQYTKVQMSKVGNEWFAKLSLAYGDYEFEYFVNEVRGDSLEELRVISTQAQKLTSIRRIDGERPYKVNINHSLVVSAGEESEQENHESSKIKISPTIVIFNQTTGAFDHVTHTVNNKGGEEERIIIPSSIRSVTLSSDTVDSNTSGNSSTATLEKNDSLLNHSSDTQASKISLSPDAATFVSQKIFGVPNRYLTGIYTSSNNSSFFGDSNNSVYTNITDVQVQTVIQQNDVNQCQNILKQLEDVIYQKAKNGEFGTPHIGWAKRDMKLKENVATYNRISNDTKIEGQKIETIDFTLLNYKIPKHVAQIWDKIQDANREKMDPIEAVNEIYGIFVEQTKGEKPSSREEETHNFYLERRAWLEQLQGTYNVRAIKHSNIIRDHFMMYSDDMKNKFYIRRLLENFIAELQYFEKQNIHTKTFDTAYAKYLDNGYKIPLDEQEQKEEINEIQQLFSNALKRRPLSRSSENINRYQNFKILSHGLIYKHILNDIDHLIGQFCHNQNIKSPETGGEYIFIYETKSDTNNQEKAKPEKVLVPSHVAKIYSVIEKSKNYELSFEDAVKEIAKILDKAINVHRFINHRDTTTLVFYEQCRRYIRKTVPESLIYKQILEALFSEFEQKYSESSSSNQTKVG